MKKIWVVGLMALLITGCGVDKQKEVEESISKKEKKMSSEQVVKELPVVFEDKKKEIKQDESLSVDINFNPKDKKMKQMTEIVEIYQDASLTQPVGVYYDYDKEAKKIIMNPPRVPLGSIGTFDVNEKDYGFTSGELLFYQEPNKQWGRVKQLFAATKVDLKTGDKLDKPDVQVIDVKQSIEERIKMTLELNKEGTPVFKWNNIKNADYYYVITYDYTKKKGFFLQGFVQAKVEKNQWIPDSTVQFMNFKVSEYERQTKENKKKYGKGTAPIKKENLDNTVYAVVGVNKDGTTAVSNLMQLNSIAGKIPLNEEIKKSFDEEGNTTIEEMNILPSHRWITMADGSLAQRLLTYDTSKAKEASEVWAEYEKDDLSDLTSKRVNIISIPYTVDGTPFKGIAKVTKYDKNQWKTELKNLEDRQNKLRNKAGILDLEIKESDVAIEMKDYPVATTKKTTNDTIYAHEKLGQYLAKQMLNGQTVIDLSNYSESLSTDKLMDNFQEAMYQNPLILGVRSIQLSKTGDKLLISYDEDNQKDYFKKQETIRQEVKKVNQKIIKKEMTELEKEYAINQYLIDSAKYDDKALENAEKNQFKQVDKAFSDSFTPYGVLINKNGVCSSYAGAFKLLADEAELESIVVTGTLEGNVPHAWNKVKIEKEWHIVDSTNNDNDVLKNSLLNIPGSASKTVLQENDEYLLNEYLVDFKASDKDKEREFYHVENRFFDPTRISKELLSGLAKDNKVTLRTNYDLDDKSFNEVAKEVNSELQSDNLTGTYWNGVIFLSNK